MNKFEQVGMHRSSPRRRSAGRKIRSFVGLISIPLCTVPVYNQDREVSKNNIFFDREGSIEAGRRLCSVSDGDEIVISGIAGVYPDSNNVNHFAEQLMNKVDLISEDDRRWTIEHPEIPNRTGKINNVEKFDAAFFGLHYNQSQCIDPMTRIFMEKSFECIVDAGISPLELRGTNTAVIVGACFSESEKTWFFEKLQANGFGVTGVSRSMMANRVSYYLGLDGPSFTVDSACSSSMYALEQGYKAIQLGHCDSVIIGGCNLCLHPYVSLQFARLGVLSRDGRCKVFDEKANGYCRSEAICAMYLQRKKDARRMYARVMHVKTNCDGFKDQGITYPSGEIQQCLLQEFYEECDIDPASLAWIETHGTGTRVGDPEEIKALASTFCAGRKDTLKIGSLKSNIGHSEPASGLCSVTKVIIAMETGLIPPNINFETPRKDIPYISDGTMQVVTEPTPWDGGLVGVNSFGFGGANCHALLNWNPKNKVNGGRPTDDLPRLVNIAARTEEALRTILDFLGKRPLDAEFVSLIHEVYKKEIPAYLWRGFTIVDKNKGCIVEKTQTTGIKRPHIVLFPGNYGDFCPTLDPSLLKLPVVAASVETLGKALKMDLKDLIFTAKSNRPDSLINNFIAVVAIQIILVDLMKSIDTEIDHYAGVSIGQISCAYADGCLTAEEAIQVAYYAAVAIVESDLPPSVAVKVGLSINQLKQKPVAGLEVYPVSMYYSLAIGPKNSADKLVEALKKDNVQFEQLKTCGYPLHSKAAGKLASKSLNYISKVLKDLPRKTNKWINESKVVDAEYFSQLVTSPISYESLLKQFEPETFITEVGPAGKHILTNIIETVVVPEQENKVPDLVTVLEALGRVFMRGVEMNLIKLYPKVEYPVARTTPMIAPLMGWDHSKNWYVGTYKLQGRLKSGEKAFTVNMKEEEFEFLAGHVVDGRNLYPATGYLALVWETLGLMEGQLYTEMDIVFEDVRFLRATNITKDGTLELVVSIQKTGNFEVTEGGAAIVTGKVYVPQDVSKEMTSVEFKSSGEYPMASKDIYKELRLRGYNYKGLFRSLIGANPTECTGKIQWHANWVAFMDNMLQTQLIYDDLRGLFVPTSIDCLVIDSKGHNQFIQGFEDREIPVFVDKDAHVIKSGGIEIRGMKVNAIARKKVLAEPVLEDYRFVPSTTTEVVLTMPQTIRVMIQNIMENEISLPKVKVVELEPTEGKPVLSTFIAQSISDMPLTQPDVLILANASNFGPDDIPSEFVVEEKPLSSDMAANIVAGRNIFSAANKNKLKSVIDAAKKGGFILSVEDAGNEVRSPELILIQDHLVEEGRMVLLRKIDSVEKLKFHAIKFTNDSAPWLKEAQEALKNPQFKRVVFYSQNDPLTGLLGFSNCIMREPECGHSRCVLIMDKTAPPFSLDHPFYSSQLSKDLSINVYKDGVWGTYRHTVLDAQSKVPVPHMYMSWLTRGDLSSLTWQEGRLSKPSVMKVAKQKKNLIRVEYAALNFRDVMLATAKLAPEVVVTNRIQMEVCTGFEFSGSLNGERVMLLSGSEGFTNLFTQDPMRQTHWRIPDSWSYEEAATVPVVYSTVLYAMYLCGNLKKGESILIHSGSGGVGQAAIRIALFEGLEVFTTVGTADKKEFLLKNFPGIKESHIGNSRDTSFEQMIMKETNGRGVDMVLNSLAEEKLLASVRCLARGGRFLEIGKYDITNNNPLGMELFKRGASFQGIMVDNLMKSNANQKLRNRLVELMQEKIDAGAIVPLPATVFPRDQQEQAFRYMATGKHIGKVLLKINDGPEGSNADVDMATYDVKPKFYCDPNMSYIVVGGLGGFGLELVDWLVLRGAKKVVVNSRRGISNGYQSFRLKWLRELYGADVRISTTDTTVPEGAKTIINEAIAMGPVGGIFNLAVVLRDALFFNQTEEQFTESLGPKANATLYLDQVSRAMCPQLEQFVVFSSVSCGLGNIGQTNYGMSNSIMERICEDRKQAGYPGLAVQWGAVGDVGLVADMQEEHVDIVIGGTLQQRISNCLELMDLFLRQDAPIVSSMVVAEKKFGAGASDNIVDTVLDIIGLRDLKTVSLHSTLAELGMDSMMAVEIKQTLEREFEVFLSPQDIRGLTFAKLQEMSSKDKSSGAAADADDDTEATRETLFAVVSSEPSEYMPIVNLPSISDDSASDANTVTFAIPGIEGFGTVLEPLAMQLFGELYCLQLDYTKNLVTVESITDGLMSSVKSKLKPGYTFNFIGYSFGGLVALEMASRLEKEGYSGKIVLIDSSPAVMKKMSILSEDGNIDRSEVLVLIDSISYLDSQLNWKEVEEQLMKVEGREARVDAVTNMVKDIAPATEYFIKRILFSLVNRAEAAREYNGVALRSIKSPTTLIRPTMGLTNDLSDYQLDQYLTTPAEVHFVEGNHLSVLSTPKTATLVNEALQKNNPSSKSDSFVPSLIPDPLQKNIK